MKHPIGNFVDTDINEALKDAKLARFIEYPDESLVLMLVSDEGRAFVHYRNPTLLVEQLMSDDLGITADYYYLGSHTPKHYAYINQFVELNDWKRSLFQEQVKAERPILDSVLDFIQDKVMEASGQDTTDIGFTKPYTVSEVIGLVEKNNLPYHDLKLIEKYRKEMMPPTILDKMQYFLHGCIEPVNHLFENLDEFTFLLAKECISSVRKKSNMSGPFDVLEISNEKIVGLVYPNVVTIHLPDDITQNTYQINGELPDGDYDAL